MRAEWRSRSLGRSEPGWLRSHPVSPEVYESYLKAEEKWARRESTESIAYFEEAIGKDPKFAPAYVGFANAYDILGSVLVGGAHPKETHPKVMSAARKAMELDPEIAEPHDMLAGVYRAQWQWSEAEAEYKRALELNPNDAGAHIEYADVAHVPGADGGGSGLGHSVPASMIRSECPAVRMAGYCFTPAVTTRLSRNYTAC